MANIDLSRTPVGDYYDANTWKFLLSTKERAIHRELWGSGVESRREALHHAHAVVLDQLGRGDRRVLDLGCGVGTAALYLARRRPVKVVGVSNSPAQVRLADRFAARAGAMQGQVRFAVADFTELPDGLDGFDLAFAIESFVHADPAAAFFAQAAHALRPGGALVVIDDVRATDREDPALEAFQTAGTPRACCPSPRSRRTPPAPADTGRLARSLIDAAAGSSADRFIHAVLPPCAAPAALVLGAIAGRRGRAAALPAHRADRVPAAALRARAGLIH